MSVKIRHSRYPTAASLLVLVLILAVGCLSIAGMGQQAPLEKPAQAMEMHHGTATTGPLKLTFGDKSIEFTAAELAALPHTTIKLFNEHAKADQSYSGVPLALLLARLGVPEKPRGKDFRLYLIAEGSDGYQVVYSIGEVTPDVHDGTTLVADSMNDKSLGDNGHCQLVTPGEKRPARWVRNLVSIRVLTAQ